MGAYVWCGLLWYLLVHLLSGQVLSQSTLQQALNILQTVRAPHHHCSSPHKLHSTFQCIVTNITSTHQLMMATQEMQPDSGPGRVQYRKALVASYFYKFFLSLVDKTQSVPQSLRSAMEEFHRPPSYGTQSFQTTPYDTKHIILTLRITAATHRVLTTVL